MEVHARPDDTGVWPAHGHVCTPAVLRSTKITALTRSRDVKAVSCQCERDDDVRTGRTTVTGEVVEAAREPCHRHHVTPHTPQGRSSSLVTRIGEATINGPAPDTCAALAALIAHSGTFLGIASDGCLPDQHHTPAARRRHEPPGADAGPAPR